MPSLLKDNYPFGDAKAAPIPLVAFAHEPTDARSACIAVVAATDDTRNAVTACRELATPIVLAFGPGELECWRQEVSGPVLKVRVRAEDVPGFFQQHQAHFRPEAIYRAKTRGRLEGTQLTFVDVGLMPLIEQEIGKNLTSLIERVIPAMKRDLGWDEPKQEQGQWLIETAFWLLAAKILHDKGVGSFESLNLTDVADVFERVEEHYGHATGKPAIPNDRLEALQEAAQKIAAYAPLNHVTTEALAAVYESALITGETRRKLGTHSTPSFLVDYIVWRLEPWIKDIPPRDRVVFEPACGHAGFLVSAMRLLGELLPPETTAQDRHTYFRERLFGLEIDKFALEIARLSLTLADIPNPDGWHLQEGSMFDSGCLEENARRAMIVLANPPFEDFSAADRQSLEKQGLSLLRNKAAEMLRRILPELRPGAVLGVVVPQGFLDSKSAAGVRKMLVSNFELQEIALFPDKVFKFSEAESAILLARRSRHTPQLTAQVRYLQICEADIDQFKRSYQPTVRRQMAQSRFADAPGSVLRIPDKLEEVWELLVPHSRPYPRLDSICKVSKGFDFETEDRLPPGTQRFSKHHFKDDAVRGFVEFGKETQIHELPPLWWLNLDDLVIAVQRSGVQRGTAQVLLNYRRVSRGHWRLKALLDRTGHPVTSGFSTVRPKDSATQLEYVWALCNNPMANAYIATRTTERNVKIRALPIPRASNEEMKAVTKAVRAYFAEVRPRGEALHAEPNLARARDLLLRVEALVLRLYGLPPRLERQLLDYFAGHKRPGVPFAFDRYYPADFTPCFSLHEYISPEFQRSTAGELRKRTESAQIPTGLLAALEAADEAYRVEEAR